MLQLLSEVKVDIVLTDVMMPGMDGLTLYREIKKLRSGTVAIVVTAYAGGDTKAEALAAGADLINDISALRQDPAMASVAPRTAAIRSPSTTTARSRNSSPLATSRRSPGRRTVEALTRCSGGRRP